MLKNDSDDLNVADDYLAQLHWNTRHSRRSALFYEPKWKYKIVYKQEEPVFSYAPLIFFSLIFIFLFLYLLYLIFFQHSFEAIFGLIFFILLTTILFFAIRDAERDPKNDDDEN